MEPNLLFLAFLILGQIIIIIVLGTTLFAESLSHRLPSFLNLLIILLINSFVYSLLFYSGDYANTNILSPTCRAQVILMHGFDSGFLAAYICLFVDVIAVAWTGIHGRTRFDTLRKTVVLVFPWLSVVVWSMVVTLAEFGSTEIVEHSPKKFYCTVKHLSKLDIVFHTYLFVGTLVLVVLQGWLGWVSWHGRCVIARESRVKLEKAVSLSLVMRLQLLAILEAITIIVNSCITGIETFTAYLHSLYPLLIGLIYLTQPELLRFWMGPYCRRPLKEPSIDISSREAVA